jgi:hypothetical protein
MSESVTLLAASLYAEAIVAVKSRAALSAATPRGLASGICGGQNGAGAGCLRVLRFPLPKPFHSTNFSILTITRDRYNRPIIGRSAAWTQCGLHLPLKKKKKKDFRLWVI